MSLGLHGQHTRDDGIWFPKALHIPLWGLNLDSGLWCALAPRKMPEPAISSEYRH